MPSRGRARSTPKALPRSSTSAHPTLLRYDERTPMKGREIRLAARPVGEPKPSDFELVEVDVPAPADGDVVVRNTLMSVDPYMRGRMNDVKSYVPPFQLGEALNGGAVGEVAESMSDTHSPGDLVLHGPGWRDYAVGPASGFRKVEPGPPPSYHLGVLG